MTVAPTEASTVASSAKSAQARAVLRLAVIDLGSNAARMAIFAYEPNRWFQQIDELRQTVRLSAGTGGSNIIRADAFEQGIATLRAFRTYCDATQVLDIVAVATSAVRDAANGASFLAAAKSSANLELQIYSGEAEAQAGVLAVANSQTYADAFVLDVGGGSAQLSRMAARQFVQGRSWPIGGVRMTEAFLTSDPPRLKDIKALERHVAGLIDKGLDGFGGGETLVGMGGTIRNLAKMHQAKTRYPLSLLHGYHLRPADLNVLVEELTTKSVAERKNLPGLNGERADVILAGAVVVRTILEASKAPFLTVSGQGLREGILYGRLFSNGLAEDVREFAAQNVARRVYDHPAHNEHVRRLSLSLFDQLTPWHQYGRFERDLLAAAALLHDIGMSIDYFQHHDHGTYLTMATALPGFSHREQAIIALLVGNHRKGKHEPGPLAPLLEPADADRIQKLAGMLRLAEYLERTKAQKVETVRCLLGNRYLQIEATGNDIAMEVRAANQRSDLLARAFGVQVEVVATSA